MVLRKAGFSSKPPRRVNSSGLRFVHDTEHWHPIRDYSQYSNPVRSGGINTTLHSEDMLLTDHLCHADADFVCPSMLRGCSQEWS